MSGVDIRPIRCTEYEESESENDDSSAVFLGCAWGVGRGDCKERLCMKNVNSSVARAVGFHREACSVEARLWGSFIRRRAIPSDEFGCETAKKGSNQLQILLPQKPPPLELFENKLVCRKLI
jgi:hypothetical protein